jgi:hypothetical protein
VAVFVVESYATVPATAPEGPVSVNDPAVSVVASIAREKVACTFVFVATPVAPEDGTVPITVGGAFAVVNDHDTGLARATPSADLTVVARFAVYVAPLLNGPVGVSVAVFVVPS